MAACAYGGFGGGRVGRDGQYHFLAVNHCFIWKNSHHAFCLTVNPTIILEMILETACEALISESLLQVHV